MTDTSQALAGVVEPILERMGLRAYDVELTGTQGHARVLRVLVERADGAPVDLDAITEATRALSPALDADRAAATVLRDHYTLEVSSPGLERPLRRPDHWHGLEGTLVSVKSRVGGVTQRSRGCVVHVDDAGVDLDVDGTRVRVEFADITQARTVFEWGPAEKVTQP